MTFYQELQLGAAGSKQVIKDSSNMKEKCRHIAVYFFKVIITLVFCIAVITVFTLFCGDENRMVGVVIVLCILLFRCVDLEICIPHSVVSLLLMFGILTFGPRLANMADPFLELPINIVCILGILVLGCHNVAMYNQCVLVLSYLLLYGYDVSGELYLLRMAGMAAGAFITILIFIVKHRRKTYERSLKNVLREFDLHSSRTRWQLALTLAVSTLLLISELLNLPRAMWAGIAAMSVLVPFRNDLTKRALRRKAGNIAGGGVFVIIYYVLPEALRPFIGIIGGVGMGFSATYAWQTMFNSLGAMSMAVDILDVRGAVFFRIFHNVFGALYALAFGLAFELLVSRAVRRKPSQE